MIPEGWGQIRGFAKSLGSPGDTELTADCPLTQLSPPRRERVRGGAGEAVYKALHAWSARSLSVFRQYRAHPPGEYSVLGQGLFWAGRAR